MKKSILPRMLVLVGLCWATLLPAAALAATPAAMNAGDVLASLPKSVSVEMTGDVATVRTDDGRSLAIKADPATVSGYATRALRPSGNGGLDLVKYGILAMFAMGLVSALFRVLGSFARMVG